VKEGERGSLTSPPPTTSPSAHPTEPPPPYTVAQQWGPRHWGEIEAKQRLTLSRS
jgi:hypothetical protein